MRSADVAIVGGGIVGLAAAAALVELPRRPRVVVLEKEAAVARHQSGRNSGVAHSGIYYRPGSAKARTCLRGRELLERFCAREGVAFERCGKVVVAVDAAELPRLAALAERARANGIDCAEIGPERLRELEPHAAGLRALHVPGTAIVDFVRVCERLAASVRMRGSEILLGAKVRRIEERGGEAVVESSAGEIRARVVVSCAGLHSDRVLAASGARRPARIVPFRGEYYELVPRARGLIRNLIYPVPDPALPFLGVHFTRRVDGSIECGPNAVPALAREGYAWDDVRLADVLDTLAYLGFWRMAAKHGRSGAAEVLRSLPKRAFTRSLQRLVPELRASDLAAGPAGVRAQALAPDGTLVDDFLIHETARAVHVLNAPSPAATASLAIAETLVERVAPRLA